MYSNTIKPSIVEPTSFNTRNARFNIDDNAYLSDILLGDFGMISPRLDPALSHNYGALSGVLSCGARITLRSGETVIDSCEDTSVFAPTQVLQCTNAHSQDINRKELLAGLGFSVNEDGAYTLTPSTVDWHGKNVANDRHLNQFNIPTADTGASGLVHLSDYLPHLKSNAELLFYPNLRLEIEWDTDPTNYHADGAGVITPTPIRPFLLLQEIVGAKDPGEQKIPYLRNVIERVVVEPVALDVTQQLDLRTGAFVNKVVKDLTFVNQPSTQGAFELWPRRQRSVAQRNEILQVVVNSEPILPDRGITSGAQKASMFNDTMSPLNMPYPAACVDSIYDQYGNMLEDDVEDIVGNYSITCVPVNNLVNTLTIRFSRTGGVGVHQRETLYMYIIGRVMSTMYIDKLKNVTIRD